MAEDSRHTHLAWVDFVPSYFVRALEVLYVLKIAWLSSFKNKIQASRIEFPATQIWCIKFADWFKSFHKIDIFQGI